MSCKAKVVATSPTDSCPSGPKSGAQRVAAARSSPPVSEEVSKDSAKKGRMSLQEFVQQDGGVLHCYEVE